MISIAVIGGGPSGLFFCHAIEKIRRQFPNHTPLRVSCFERSSQPGGVWRAATATDGDTTSGTDMYSQLWSNGCSHCLEFHDYTFDQHFGAAVPVYLKRQELLEYILGRVQHQCPDFFAKYVHFRHSVDHVAYDATTQKFAVTVRDLNSDTVDTQQYDKCIWACGENGRRLIPKPIAEAFEDFHGPVLHSADVADAERFTTVVRNKRILLVGGGYSAEDIALQAIQTGADHVYICVRNYYASEVRMTRQWPGNKVTMVPYQVPFLVTGNGDCIQFHESAWDFDHYKRASSGVSTKIRGIDTVILCTGYRKNLDMLDAGLREDGFPSYEYNVDDKLAVPNDWAMPLSNLGELIGHVPVPDNVEYPLEAVHPRFYHGVQIANPNMMFISQYGSDLPLWRVEAVCALLAGFASGTIPVPSAEVMRRRNAEEALLLMKNPYFRYTMDRKYAEATNNVWPEDSEPFQAYDDEVDLMWPEQIKIVAAIMNEARYPVTFGTRQELNDLGRQIEEMGHYDTFNRSRLSTGNEQELMWKTFRDNTDYTSKFRSIYTGTVAVPLGSPWMRLQAEAQEKESGRKSPRSVDDPPPYAV